MNTSLPVPSRSEIESEATSVAPPPAGDSLSVSIAGGNNPLGRPAAAAPARLLTAATMRPLRVGDTGPLIGTLRSMLVKAGLLDVPEQPEAGTAAGEPAGGEPAGGEPAGGEPVFDEPVRSAVREFQQDRGLVADGVVGPQTALLLDEARWRFGQRTLLLTSGHLMRGDDVAALQERLVVLGMHAGPVDGIFGVVTDRSVRELQRGLGLNPDGMFGPATLEAMSRLSRSVEGGDAWALRSGVAVEMAGRRLVGKIIALDAANGSDGRGVTGFGLVEADITHDIVRRLADRLRQVGADVVLTHDPGSTASTVARADAAKAGEAHLVISFHCEMHASPLASGLATFYWGGGRIGQHSAVGQRLADLIQREIVARTDVVDCRIHPCAYDLVRLTPMPAVMVGLGYLSNASDAHRLADSHSRDLIAEAVLVAVQRLYLDDHEARTGALNLKDIIARSQAPE
jgi:N-acetylmuramoyl-L-alanine amidase